MSDQQQTEIKKINDAGIQARIEMLHGHSYVYARSVEAYLLLPSTREIDMDQLLLFLDKLIELQGIEIKIFK